VVNPWVLQGRELPLPNLALFGFDYGEVLGQLSSLVAAELRELDP